MVVMDLHILHVVIPLIMEKHYEVDITLNLIQGNKGSM